MNPPKTPANKRSAYWRNLLRGAWRDVASIVRSEGLVEENAVDSLAIQSEAITSIKIAPLNLKAEHIEDQSMLTMLSGELETIDGSPASLNLAAGQELKYDAVALVNTTGLIIGASKARTVWSQSSYSGTGAGAEPVALSSLVTSDLIAFFPIYKWEDDKTIRLDCEANTSNASYTTTIELGFTNGSGSFIQSDTTIQTVTYETLRIEIDVTSGGAFGEEHCFGYINMKTTNVLGTARMRRALVQILSKDGY